MNEMPSARSFAIRVCNVGSGAVQGSFHPGTPATADTADPRARCSPTQERCLRPARQPRSSAAMRTRTGLLDPTDKWCRRGESPQLDRWPADQDWARSGGGSVLGKPRGWTRGIHGRDQRRVLETWLLSLALSPLMLNRRRPDQPHRRSVRQKESR